jgi:folate-binding protein YgfZ
VAEGYLAVREAAGVTDRSSRGKVAVTGADRAGFLHGLLTHEVVGLSKGGGNHACITDPRGATQADLHVYHWGDRFVLETEAGLQGPVMAFLNRFLIADDAALTDVTDDFAIVGVHGPKAVDIVASRGGKLPSLPLHHHHEGEVGGVPVRIVRRGYTGQPGLDLWTTPDAAPHLISEMVAAGARKVKEEALETLRVEAGVPRYGHDLDASVAPPEGGLPHTGSYSKGCFIGQEMLAKMHNLGKPRRYLVGLLVPGDPPAPGTPLLSGDEEVGKTKSSVRSPRLGAIALASVRRGSEVPGGALALPDGRGAVVTSLPFEGSTQPGFALD